MISTQAVKTFGALAASLDIIAAQSLVNGLS
jgi:hypothetical protein